MILLGNIIFALWIFAIWYLIGLGPLFVLLPRSHRAQAFLLAPLLGMALFALMGLFELVVLLMPLFPKINAAVLLIVSLSILIWNRHLVISTWKSIAKRMACLSIIPCLLLITFAFLFHQNGYYLLVGSSDQLHYCLNAKHMGSVMHTNSALDSPIARQDHYVQEMATRILCYLKSYRRGAEVMLATTKALTGQNMEEAFPLNILCLLLTLGFALGFVARMFRLSLSGAMLLQMTFLSSFYLLLLHIQGSLALLTSLSLELVTLLLLTRSASHSGRHWIVLTGIIVAAYFAIYAEPAAINILVPTLALIVWQFFKSKAKGLNALIQLMMVYGVACFIAPYAIYSVIVNASSNLQGTLVNVQAIHANLSTLFQSWTVAPVILGVMSYYDNSEFNNSIATYIARFPWCGAICFFVFSCFSLCGYFKTKNKAAWLLSLVLLMWIVASWILFYLQDYLRFVRSLHYAMPLMLLGLVLLATRTAPVKWMGRLMLIMLIAINLATDIRVGKFLLSHTISNDPILLRYQEQALPWQQLRQELHYSAEHETPVLISGFKETIRPLAIASLVGSQTHVLGTSMAFWPIYSNAGRSKTWVDFNTHYTEQQFRDAFNKENQDWSLILNRLIDQSQQAVVPVGGDFPEEWKKDKDVYAPHIKRFANICDVVYRHGFAAELPVQMVSPLRQDQGGFFRWVNSSGYILVHVQDENPKIFMVKYDGLVSNIKLKIGNQYYSGSKNEDGYNYLSAIVSLEQAKNVRLMVYHPVKLRSMSWTDEQEY